MSTTTSTTCTNSFTCFSALPPELRLRIWKEALSVPSVWAAVCNTSKYDDPGTTRPPVLISRLGPKPFLVGLSCREARRELERLYGQPLHVPRGLGETTDVYWVNLDKTVVYLGNSDDAETVIDTFDCEQLSRFRHIALTWHPFYSLATTCKRLAAVCPALCTIIIHRAPNESAFSRRPLNPKIAAYWATLSEYSGPELVLDKLFDMRDHALRFFSDPLPRLHMLPPTFAG